MKFEVKSQFVQKDVYEFQRVAAKTVLRGKTRASKTVFFIFAALFLLFGAYIGITNNEMTTAIGGLIAAVIICIPALVYDRFISWSSWMRWRRANGRAEMIYAFSAESFTEQVGDRPPFTNKYSDLYACFENKNYFFLFFSKREGYMLKKSDFVQGEPAKFRKFVEKQSDGRIQFYTVSDGK